MSGTNTLYAEFEEVEDEGFIEEVPEDTNAHDEFEEEVGEVDYKDDDEESVSGDKEDDQDELDVSDIEIELADMNDDTGGGEDSPKKNKKRSRKGTANAKTTTSQTKKSAKKVQFAVSPPKSAKLKEKGGVKRGGKMTIEEMELTDAEADLCRTEAARKARDKELEEQRKKYCKPRDIAELLLKPAGWDQTIESVNKLRASRGFTVPAPQLPQFLLPKDEEIYQGKERVKIFSTHNRYVPWPADNPTEPAPERYTKHGKYHCFWCTEPFEGIPFPVTGSHTAPQNYFYVYGYFCSPECSNSYCFEKHGSKGLMTNGLMMKLSYGMKITEQQRAPPREALKKFGGYMDIEAFRGCRQIKIDFTISRLPMANSHIGIVELEKIVTETVKVYQTGFEEVVAKNTRFPSNSIAPMRIVTASQGFQMQKGAWAQMPTLDEQIRLAQSSASDLKISRVASTVKKTKNLKDFMIKKT